jgi:formylmethanofuran dehydrogenase subunit E
MVTDPLTLFLRICYNNQQNSIQGGKSMDLFDTIKAQGQEVVKKAKEVTENVKLNNQIREEENKMREAFTEIGELYYEEHNEIQEDKYVEAFKTIELAKEKIIQLKGIRTCENCGADVSKDAVYCSKCGEKIEL